MITVGVDKVLVNHEFIDDSYDRAGNTNVGIAAMVTSYARIKLYSIIDEIERSSQGRVLYYDTDSVIFVDKKHSGWNVPEIGDFLGDMTDEIAKDYGPESYIKKFACGGAKNYAYVVKTPTSEKMVTKIKGLNITSGLKEELNFDVVRDYAMKYRNGDVDAFKTVDQLQFRTTNKHQVFTSLFAKKYRAVLDKRIVLKKGFLQTVPFGYDFKLIKRLQK